MSGTLTKKRTKWAQYFVNWEGQVLKLHFKRWVCIYIYILLQVPYHWSRTLPPQHFAAKQSNSEFEYSRQHRAPR